MTWFSKIVQRRGIASHFLYRITKDAVEYKRTASRKDQSFIDGTWTGSQDGLKVWHDELRDTNDSSGDYFVLKFAVTDPLAATYLGRQEDYDTQLTMYHALESGEYVVKYVGVLVDIEQNGEELHLYFGTAMQLLDSYRPASSFSRQCDLALYGAPCGISRAAFTITAEVTAISNRLLTIPDAALQADGYYTLGIVKFGNEERAVESHTGTQVKVDQPISALVATNDVELSAGCDRKRATCRDKFANVDGNGKVKALTFPMINENPTRL